MRILLLLLGASLAAIGQTRSFDTYTYVIPSGYSEKVAPRFVQLNKIDTAGSSHASSACFWRNRGRVPWNWKWKRSGKR